MTSAKIAMPSSVKTMKAPRRPSGFSLISRTPTSRKRERVRCTVVRRTTPPSTALALEIISAFLPRRCPHLYPLTPTRCCIKGEGAQMLTITDTGIEVGIAEVHNEIQQEPEGGPDQIDALHHREVPANQRLKEETPHARQPEDGLDDHRPAEIEVDLQANDAHHRNQGVFNGVLEDHTALR